MRPIFSIWIKPLKTFELLQDRNEIKNDSMIAILFFLGSMAAGFSGIPSINKLFGGENYFVIIISLFVIGFFGLFLWYYVFSFIIWTSSKIFQGKATLKEIRLTIAYSLVPNLVHLIIGLIMFIPAIMLDNIGLINYQHPITYYILWIFALRIIIIGLAHFNKYSYGYALLTIFIPAAILQGLAYGIKLLIE